MRAMKLHLEEGSTVRLVGEETGADGVGCSCHIRAKWLVRDARSCFSLRTLMPSHLSEIALVEGSAPKGWHRSSPVPGTIIVQETASTTL
jgi:hypothetical protein